MESRINHILELTGDCIRKVHEKYPPYNSLHEAFAVLDEEVRELRQWVDAKEHLRDPYEIRQELLQIMTVCGRALLCFGLDDDTVKDRRDWPKPLLHDVNFALEYAEAMGGDKSQYLIGSLRSILGKPKVDSNT